MEPDMMPEPMLEMDEGLPEDEGMEAYGEQAEQVLPLEAIAGQGMDLAQMLPDDVLGRIALECVEAYDRDKGERTEWEHDYDEITAMVKGERKEKAFPWPGASNVRYPLIATAALQFGARAYPAIVKNGEVAKVRVNGADPEGQKRQRANRVADHMNWQLIEDMPEWEDETDKLVHMLPIHGCVFRQAIWDPTYTRPKTSLVSAKHLVVSQNAKDLETVPHFVKEFELFPHEIREKMRGGQYLEKEIKFEGEQEKKVQQMLECHCRYDLDEDGYDEPWIAVIHKESQTLLSLKAGFWPDGVERGEPSMEYPNGRIIKVRRHVEFTKYDFIPAFDGSFLGVGFGFLLREHNEIINTTLNQLFDAATDQNAGGGFIGRGPNFKGGSMEFEPGEWKQVNVTGTSLRDAIVPRPTSQPSPVLFNLLGIMIEAGKELSSIRDAMSGEAPANQPATTTLAIIEQGLQVFSSIYKRIYRAMGKELKLIYKLNAAYLPPEAYFQVLDDQKAILQADYMQEGNDVCPVADPSITTSAQRLARAQFLLQFANDPRVNGVEILKRAFEAAEIDDIETLFPQADPMQQQIEQRAAVANVSVIEGEAADKMAAAKLKEAQAMVALKEANMPPEQPEPPEVTDPMDAALKALTLRKAELDVMDKERNLALAEEQRAFALEDRDMQRREFEGRQQDRQQKAMAANAPPPTPPPPPAPDKSLEAVGVGLQAIAASQAALAASIGKPKTIKRGPDGRAIGVE